MLGMLQHFLRVSHESQIRLKSTVDSKIDRSCVPSPGEVSLLRPDHHTSDSDEAAKEIPRSASHSRLHALPRLKSPVRGLTSPHCLPWSYPKKVNAVSAEGLLISLDGDFGFENVD
jgi:hypothetical protein